MDAPMDAAALDRADPLRALREEFDLPEGVIYLDGNSLGPPPSRALERLTRTAAREWKEGLIRSWNDAGWIDLPMSAGAKVARLIGAEDDEVIVADSVTVNLFKLASALIEMRPRKSLCVEADEFPTDQYVMSALSKIHGAPLRRIDGDAIPDDAGVVVRSLAHYKTAAIADMAEAEEKAARIGAAIIWDLSHAAGLLAIDVKRNGAKFAVGCGYKYLNGGPGAPAFLYASRDEAQKLNQPIAGWMGHASPFDFAPDYRPADGARRFAAGTPPILSLAALDAALDLFDELDMRLLEEKARSLGALFLERTAALGFPVLDTKGARGGHVCLHSENGYQIMQALIAKGVIGDFRPPGLMRFGFSPLFLSFAEIDRAASILSDIIKTEDWRRPEYSKRSKVT
ncbi:MAG: aminotransferase class V-fold PLP-dependent enzyme [Parvularculaceae bacterium]